MKIIENVNEDHETKKVYKEEKLRATFNSTRRGNIWNAKRNAKISGFQ